MNDVCLPQTRSVEGRKPSLTNHLRFTRTSPTTDTGFPGPSHEPLHHPQGRLTHLGLNMIRFLSPDVVLKLHFIFSISSDRE